MPFLVITSGPSAGTAFQLVGAKTTIGRDYTQDIRLPDGKASRQHAVILDRGGAFAVRDLGSSNGTFVADSRIEEAELSDGDVIRIGRTEMRFGDPGAAEPEAKLTEEFSPTQTVELELGGADPLERLASSTISEPAAALLALGKIARDLAEADDPQGLYGALAEHLPAALGSDRVYVLEPAGSGWRIAGVPGTEMDRKLAGTPVSRTIVRHVADGLVPTLMANPEDDERFAGAASIVTGRIVTAAAAPITSGDELAGVLYADRLGRGEPFGEEDLELLAAAAGQASLHAGRLSVLDRVRRGKRRLEKELRSQYAILGESPQIEEVFDFIERAAPTDAGVLILGESGSGKELVARALHLASARADGPFEVVNCAALAESLAESELFGHAKGAFTGAAAEKAGRFELADGGTIFLDEVGELSEACQAKLLRVLENGESVRVGESKVRGVDVRVVAATNRDLDARVAGGAFREDLFYRLNVLRIEAPPLRSRTGDIDVLTGHFLGLFAGSSGRAAPGLSPEARAAFNSYRWPGNVRELKNICERLVVMCRSDEIPPAELPPEMLGAGPRSSGDGEPDTWDLEELERRHILRAVEAAGGNKSRASEMLGIDRSTLYAKLRRYGEDPGE